LSAPIARIERLGCRFGALAAVDGVDLDIAAGEFLALLGASGSGKSTLLRAIAGFEPPAEGRIEIDGRDMAGVPPHRRPVNMMFQSYALFPHLDVASNIGFGLRQEGVAAAEIARRVDEAMAMVAIGHLAGRKPDRLSGGERQRVALMRALIKRPMLLLLDEPLSALDRKLRAATRRELAAIQRQVGIAFVMVTHDAEEAIGLADRLAVMDRGKLLQIGPPRQVYDRPANRRVAQVTGEVNIVEGSDATWLDLGAGAWAIRPERIMLGERAAGLPRGGMAEVVELRSTGALWQVTLASERGARLSAALLSSQIPPTPGTRLAFGFAADAAVPVPP